MDARQSLKLLYDKAKAYSEVYDLDLTFDQMILVITDEILEGVEPLLSVEQYDVYSISDELTEESFQLLANACESFLAKVEPLFEEVKKEE